MPKRNRRPPTPARIPPEPFSFGRYTIVGQPNSQCWYRKWREKGVSSTKRLSLGTEDFEEAKVELVNVVNREFSDDDTLQGDPLVTNVLNGFAADPMSRIGCWSTFGAMQDYAEAHWQGVTLRKLTLGMRKAFANSVIAGGSGAGHASNQLSYLSRAFAWAGKPQDDNRILCPDPPRFPTGTTWIREVTGASRAKPKNWSPEPEGMARVLRAMAHNKALVTWAFMALYTAGRPTVVRLLGPNALGLRRGQTVVDLHPPTWERSPKRNPCLPVGGPILAEILAWGDDERWCPHTEGWLQHHFARLRKVCRMPLLQPSSFRDYGATVLRHAHIDFGTPEVTEEFAERWMGHRDVPTTDEEEGRTIHRRYGIYRPDYLRTPRLAMEAMMLDLDRLSGGVLFRHTNPHADRQNTAEHRRSEFGADALIEGKSAPGGRADDLWRADTNRGLARELLDLDAAMAGKPVKIGGIRGSFRQIPAKPFARLDEAFERKPSDVLSSRGASRMLFVPADGIEFGETMIIVTGNHP